MSSNEFVPESAVIPVVETDTKNNAEESRALKENSKGQMELDAIEVEEEVRKIANTPEETGIEKKTYPVQTSLFNAGKAIEYFRTDVLIPPDYYSSFDCQTVDTSLVDNIKKIGIQTPVLVKKSQEQEGIYDIVDGYRRVEALKKLKMDFVPCLVISPTEGADAAIISFTVNHERKVYNPITQACFYQYLQKTHKLTLKKIAERFGTSDATIHNKLSLLELPEKIQGFIVAEDLPETHARELAQLETEEEQLEMAALVISETVSVKKLRKMIEDHKSNQENDGKQEA